jgi:hypothetical protein
MKRWLIANLLILLIVQISVAAISGKITGVITDAQTGQPLSGANIMLEGTDMGSFSDDDGFYVVLNVPPGTYTLKISMIGYQILVIRELSVDIDLTSRGDGALIPGAIEMGEVVALAERPVVKADVAASQLSVSSEEIARLPIHKLDNILGLQAGVSSDLTIRGSSAYQAAFMVDGLMMNDERSNIPYTAIPLSSIQEVNIQTGGFNAEYENARSGVINVVTREGNRDYYSGAFTIRYKAPASKHFGESIYGENSYYVLPYNDDDVCWTGTNNGSWDAHQQKNYPAFMGFSNMSIGYNTDDNPDNDMTAAALQQLYRFQHRRTGHIEDPDYTIDFGFGGPFPLLSQKLGGLRFFLSYREEQSAYTFPLSRPTWNDNNLQLKLTSNLSVKTKLMISGVYGEEYMVSKANWTTLPDGSNNFRSTYDVAAVGKWYQGMALYIPATFNPGVIYRSNIGAKITHQISGRSYVEIDAQKMFNTYYIDRIAPRDTTKRYELWPGYFADESPFGYFADGDATIVGMRTDWVGFAMDRSKNSTTKFKADYTSQLGQLNQLKTGISLILTEYRIDSWIDHPTHQDWRFFNDWFQQPWRLGAYIQDKLEFEGMVMNVGLRFDYSNGNTDWYQLSPYDELLTAMYGFELDSLARVQGKTDKAKGIWSLSPRFAVSHPISELSKIYFNYGHFNALPRSEYRFVIDRRGNGAINKIGNPELEYSKTIAYELGYEHSMMEQYLIKAAAYYKDISNQPSWTQYINTDNSITTYRAESNHYEDIRGLELTLSKNSGRWITGFINYTYQVGTSGYFGIGRYYENVVSQRQYEQENPYQSKPKAQPYARASIDLHTPAGFSFAFLPPLLLENWNLNLLAEWQTGAYSTYGQLAIKDNVQWKDYYNLDLRFSKNFKLKKSDFVLFFDVSNALNLKRLSYAGFVDNYDYTDYMESLRFSWEEGAQKGNDRIGDFREDDIPYRPFEPADPNNLTPEEQEILDTKAYIDMPNLKAMTFLNPRAITFGLKINF